MTVFANEKDPAAEIPSIIFVLFLLSLVMGMILPMPTFILDLGLVGSFCLAIMILSMVSFSQTNLEFSSFPSILIASLMLRLSINVNTTRLIVGEGHTGLDAAGNVIAGFGGFIMGGSLFMGLVVFCILLIVNFMVITKGASRMAEVSARFALDGMPGRQLSIDSDLSAGSISHEEAKSKRENVQKEAAFYGSLDGVSKFIKGDAVAGLLITLVNLVCGTAVGVISHGLPFVEAISTYSILTVGDGLVAQIPAVIISIAAGLLLAKGDSRQSSSLDLSHQFLAKPKVFFLVGGLLILLGVLPGLPFLPFCAVGAGIVLGGVVIQRTTAQTERDEVAVETVESDPVTRVGDFLDLDDLHVIFAPNLVQMALDPATGLDVRIANMRKYTAEAYGVILPEIRLTDDPSLERGKYVIKIQGVVVADGILEPNKALLLSSPSVDPALKCEEIREPVFGAPACWVDEAQLSRPSLDGITSVSACEVLSTHLLDVVKSNFDKLLTLRSLRQNFQELTDLSNPRKAEMNRKFLDDIIPDKVKPEFLLSVLRLLLRERVSIRNLPFILETMVEAIAFKASAENTCEFVRQKLGFQIVGELVRPDGTLAMIQLAPAWEDMFSSFQIDQNGQNGFDIALPPENFRNLSDSLEAIIEDVSGREQKFAVVVPARRRRFIRTVMDAKKLSTPVISYEEMGLDVNPVLVGTVAFGDE